MKQNIVAILGIFLVTFSIFRLSPVYNVTDSRYTILFSERLLFKQSVSLDAQTFEALKAQDPGLYQIQPVENRYYYVFPIGGVALSTPFVAIAHALGFAILDSNGTYDFGREVALQQTLASAVSAAFVAVVFVTSRLILSLPWSLLIGLVSGLCTQVWSTASRGLWGHTWGILILAVAIHMIVRKEVGKGRWHPILLGTSLSWLYFVRPGFFPSILAITVFVLIRWRKNSPAILGTGCFWLIAFIGYSYFCFHAPLPQIYSASIFHPSENFFVALAGTLISPSRGLFVFVPWLTFIGYLLVRFRSVVRLPLVILAIAAIVGHLVLIGVWWGWRGGHCYGARLTTDIVPWFSLLTILAIEARLKVGRQNAVSTLERSLEWSVAGALVLIAGTLNCLGAVWADTIWWNARPNNVDEHEERVWDWKHPQFLGIPSDT